MAKKHRHRTWFVALLQEQTDLAFLNRRLPEGTVMFDREALAYGYGQNQRLLPQRDENGNYILDDEGRAQLPTPQRMTVIGIKGKAIDWNRVNKAPKGTLQAQGITGDFIQSDYVIPLNKITIESVLEESDEAFEKFKASPLVKAGTQDVELKATAKKVVEELQKDGAITAEDSIPASES